MFGTTKNTTSRTDNMLVKMSEMMIHSTWDPNIKFVTQTKLVYQKPFDPFRNHRTSGHGWIISERHFVEEARKATLDGTYMQGDGSTFPFTVEFTLTREHAQWWYPWSVLRAFLHVDLAGKKYRTRRDFHFGQSAEGRHPHLVALEKLFQGMRENAAPVAA